jgi:hypothetical protein
VTTVLAVRQSSISELLLGCDNVLDFLVLNGSQLGLGDLAGLKGELGVQELVGAQERAEVLCAERRTLVKLRSHCEV